MEGADLTSSMVSPMWTEDVEYEDQFLFNTEGQEAKDDASQEAIKTVSLEAKKDQKVKTESLEAKKDQEVTATSSQETGVQVPDVNMEEFNSSAEQLAADIAKVSTS